MPWPGCRADAVTLHVAGRDDVDPAYAKLVGARLTAPDLAGRVITHGAVSLEEVARLYQGADVFVLLSREETYGTAYGEALRAGLPTIGWRSGNLPNLIVDGREGCVLRPGDVAGVRSALLADGGRSRVAGRSERRRRSPRRARLPTWDDAADAFFGALRALARTRG